MEVLLKLSRRATYADYLAAEQTSERRHELLDGVIVALPGGSDEHNALSGQLAQLLANRRSGSCRYYSPDQRFWIASKGRGRYADGSIICGPPEHPAHDDQATTNPLVTVEVMSPSSEGDDDGDKRHDFQSLASLQAYVLVAQDQRRVKVYRRTDQGWQATTYREGERFELPGVLAAIAVADVYDGILDEAGRSLLRRR
ncbi:MAG TPA: Uma2 family endonuclease [Kofleriaceae bacterium]|nr:Uma2 family endonuclease [Kofleriaceae bacterium]